MRIDFYLNGELSYLEVKPQRSLMDILKFDLELPFIRLDCRRGHNGSCTVLVDDFAVASCLLPAFNVQGRHIETLDGLMKREDFDSLEQGFLRAGFYPCKHCAPSKTILAEAILRRNITQLNDAEILEYSKDSWCNCTSRASFVRAVCAADSIRKNREAIDANRS